MRRFPITLAAAALLGTTCATSNPRELRVFPTDQVYTDVCPGIDVRKGEYAELTVLESNHTEDEMLLATCDEARVPGCAARFCAESRTACLPGRVFRRLYDRPAGAGGPGAGAKLVAVPFCENGRCDLGFSVWVVAPDASVKRWTNCRLVAGTMTFEDAGDPNRSVRVKCRVIDLVSTEEPRDCYPIY